MVIDEYILNFSAAFPAAAGMRPWEVTQRLIEILLQKTASLPAEFNVRNGIAIHRNAVVEEHVILKGPLIICDGCFIGSHAYLRNGVFLGNGSSVGPGCEVKTSIIFEMTEIAHLNFVGDSILGSHINFEAGAIAANYYNERADKKISVAMGNKIVATGVEKFGSLIGDQCRIGANAVLSPGTILKPKSIVKRLELVEQVI